MAPLCPHHAPATRNKSHLNATIGGIKKRSSRWAYLDAIRLSVDSSQVHGDVKQSAPFLLPASSTDPKDPPTDFEDVGSSTTTLDCAADEENVWKAADCEHTNETSELPQLQEENAATRQPSQGDHFEGLGSLDRYWSPWESELLQDEFWDSGSDFEKDAAF